jgi:hypothetical protein
MEEIGRILEQRRASVSQSESSRAPLSSDNLD